MIKKLAYIIVYYIAVINSTFADVGILGASGGTLTETNIRRGEIHTSDIPNIIKSAIDFFMSLAGTIAIIFVIIGAYKILFGSLEQDKTKGKDTIFMALGGFALAALSWFIIKLIIDNLS